MKIKTLTLITSALAALTFTHHASANLLYDDFNDGTIDTGLWQTSTPFGDSSITESGGNAVFLNRGRLLSVTTFPTSIDITGRFQLTGNIRDQFNIITRTNGVTTNGAGEFDIGISFRFAIQDDPGNTTNNIKIASSMTFVAATFPLALNTPYDFRITDNGTNLALYITNLSTPLLTATDSSVLSNRIGFYNREGSGGGSSISAGSTTRLDSVQVIPEPSSCILLLTGAALCSRRRLRRTNPN